jgi:hypothetical protein
MIALRRSGFGFLDIALPMADRSHAYCHCIRMNKVLEPRRNYVEQTFLITLCSVTEGGTGQVQVQVLLALLYRLEADVLRVSS